MEILAIPFGGLGNKMQCIDACAVLAQRLDAKLIIVWRIDHELGASFFELFAPPAPPIEVINVRSWEEAEKIVTSFAPTKTFTGEWLRAARPTQDYWTPGRFSRTDRLLVNCWQRFMRDGNANTIFRPNKFIEDIIAGKAQLADGAIGVHIRRTDHQYAISRSPTDQFLRVLDRQKQERRFFLSTDDQCEEVILRDRFGMRVSSYPKRSLHRADTVAIQDAVVDLYLLARTDLIVGSFGSTFSETAAFLGNVPLQVVNSA